MPTYSVFIAGLTGSGTTPGPNRVDPKSREAGRHKRGELGLVLDRVDPGEIGLQRRGVELLEPRLVHIAGEKRADLAVLGRIR